MKPQIDSIAHSTDASMIEGKASSVIYPKTAEEVKQIIIAGNNITIRGGGSGLVGGAVPNGIVVDLSKMNKILNLDRQKKEVEVETGIILDELNEYLEKYNLEFPVQPGSHSICTIGGMIATNAVGNRAIKYGRTSNLVVALEVVNGKGEILKIGKAELADFSGMEGITGVIVKAKLKLVEKKKRSATLFSFNEIEKVIDAVRKIKLVKDVSEIEFLDKFCSSLLGLEEKYHLIVELESEAGKLKNEEYEKIMIMRDSVYPVLAKLGYTHIEDPKILLHKFSELANFLEAEKIPFFGHLGVGIIHPVFRSEDRKKIKEMIKLVRKLHGQITGEHGIGICKKEFLDNLEKKVIERVKLRCDPLCKLNYGKIIDLGRKDVEEKVEQIRAEKKEQEKVEEIIEEVRRVEEAREQVEDAEELVEEARKEVDDEKENVEEAKEEVEDEENKEQVEQEKEYAERSEESIEDIELADKQEQGEQK